LLEVRSPALVAIGKVSKLKSGRSKGLHRVIGECFGVAVAVCAFTISLGATA
jgi:hypothetical protein